jgi:O-antigen/teichoic acid export membrane protein
MIALRRLLGATRSLRTRIPPTFPAFLGLGGQAALQLVFAVVAARALAVDDFGRILLIISICSVAHSFVGLGAGGVVVKMVAREPARANHFFGQALCITGASLLVLLPTVIVAAAFASAGQLPLWIIVVVAGCELSTWRVALTCWQLFIGREDQTRAAFMAILTPALRVAAAGLTLLFDDSARLESFAVLYSAANVLAAIACLLYVARIVGPAALSVRGYPYWDGFTFAATWANASLQAESDKLIVGMLGGPAELAVYGIASRLMDGAAMPPRALRISVHSRLFREGASGQLGSFRPTVAVLPIIVAYGILAWILFAFGGSVFAWIFGPGYGQLAQILPILGALPLLRAVADLGAEIFITSNLPGVQVLVQTFSTASRILVGLVLVYLFGLYGAIGTALAITAATAVLFWSLALRMRDGGGASNPPATSRSGPE